MTGSARRKALIWLGLVMVATAAIAAGLPRLELQPGLPRPSVENSRLVIRPVEDQPVASLAVNEFVKILFGLVLAGCLFYALYKLARGLSWRDLGSLLPVLLASLAIAGVILALMAMLLSGSPRGAGLELPVPTPVPSSAPLGPVPPLLFWLVGIGVLVMGGLIAIWIFGPSSRPARTVELVGSEAEKAWQAIQSGLDLRGVILQCYRQMSLALERERGIERKEWMTTREFEEFLEAAGLPHDPIHQLTELFEAVRYGDWQPNPPDEEKALHCLQAIMLHSRQAGGLG